jgi:hypothetical protein
VPTWGSAALLEVALPEEEEKKFEVSLPLHLRYLTPLNASHVLTPVPYPALFFACPSENSGSKFAAAPFDRTNLGYDGLFGSNTLFYHVPPLAGERSVVTLTVPVLDLRAAKWVEMGTVAAVVLGTLWILAVLARGVWRDGVGVKKSAAKKTQ